MPPTNVSTMRTQKLISYVLAIFVVCLCSLLLFRQRISAIEDPLKCRALTTTGSWSGEFRNVEELQRSEWRPTGCMMHNYSSKDIEGCYGINSILFIGDSTTRQIYWATAQKINKSKANGLQLVSPKHGNLTYLHGRLRLVFLWDPFLNETSTLDLLKQIPNSSGKDHLENFIDPLSIVIGVGLWHARYLKDEYQDAFNKSIARVGPYLHEFARRRRNGNDVQNPSHAASSQYEVSRFAFLPVLLPYEEMLSQDRSGALSLPRIEQLNQGLRILQERDSFDVLWSLTRMTEGHPPAYGADGIHVVQRITSIQANIMLNLFCQSHVRTHHPFNNTCCAPVPGVNAIQQSLLLLAGCVTLWALCCNVANIVFGKHLCHKSHSLGYLTGLQAVTVFALVLLYCFAADRSSFFGKIDKISSQSSFLALAGSTCLACLFTLIQTNIRSESSERPSVLGSAQQIMVLSRQQTEEWKGWMQIIILWYHYFGMSKVLWVYQVVRLLVASYLFMTGYGHTTYYLNRRDFSLKRLCAVLLRLNLLSSTLPYFMATDYDLYYFPALSSFWCLVVYLTLVSWSRHEPSIGFLMFRIIASAVVTKKIVSWPGILETIFNSVHSVLRMNVNVYEFRFRVSLDMYIVYVGMTFGIVSWKFPRMPSDCWKELSPQLWSKQKTGLALLNVISVATLMSYVCFCRQFGNKFDYNKWHPITSALPILAFIAIRNSTTKLRSYHVPAFAWIGRCSLETYILQYHIWLAADTKGLLHLPFFDSLWVSGSVFLRKTFGRIEFLIITVYFLWASWGMCRATSVISSWMTKSVGTSYFGIYAKMFTLLVCLLGLNWLWPK